MAGVHQDLEVWQKSMDLVTQVYSITRQFPKEELYGLTSQIRRAAVSVPSNIAEGRSRRGTKDYTRFLIIARGSVAELETQLIISKNLNYMDEQVLASILDGVNRIGRMLNGLISKLDEKLKQEDFPVAVPRSPSPVTQNA